MPISRAIATGCLAFISLTIGHAVAEDAPRPDKVSFYFAAHQDDWQLFMNPSAFQDVIKGAAKTVFIHVTAGDAGLGMGSGGRKHPFFRARENGAEQAIRFMVDANDQPAEKVASHITLNGHAIYRIGYRNTVSYFLRVPDGHWTGDGYYDTGYQSLQRLNAGVNNTLRAIDGSTAYNGWSDFTQTLRALMDHERGTATQVQINVAEVEVRINPQDHSDHVMTARAALDAVSDLQCIRRVFYVDYASSKLPENLNSQQRDMESSVFAVTLAGVQALGHGTSWNHYQKSYVGRNYFRVREGNGRCTGPLTQTAAAKR
jgi:hypothetical protein